MPAPISEVPKERPTLCSLKLHYRYRETVYHTTILRLLDEKPEPSIVLDGVQQAGAYITLIDDRKDHHAELRFYGPAAEFQKESAISEIAPVLCRSEQSLHCRPF